MIILPNLFYEKIVLGYFPDLFKFVKLMDNGEVDGNLGHRFLQLSCQTFGGSNFSRSKKQNALMN